MTKRPVALCLFLMCWRSCGPDPWSSRFLSVPICKRRGFRSAGSADYKHTFANDLSEAETHLTTLPDTGTPWKVQRGRLIRRCALTPG